jgi:SAM-dependent methyltransferase
MGTHQDWLDGEWRFVRAHLPPAPASVVEIGCGPGGGFVGNMARCGYDAVGVDPDAPDAPGFHRIPFERYGPARSVDAIVACTALHHVDDLGEVLDRAASALSDQGVLIVVEFAWELFDETTAQWCFARLPPAGSGWLHDQRIAWTESGRPWPEYRAEWAAAERLHRGAEMLGRLDARFDRRLCVERLPYFFGDLPDVDDADEQAAIAAGLINGTGIRYVGTVEGRA